MRRNLPFTFTVSFFIISLVFLNQSFAEETTANQPPRRPVFAGKLFGVPVPIDNYLLIKGAFIVFGNKWGQQPKTPEELDKYIWNQLLLSYEAYRRGITVDRREIDKEIDKVIKLDKAEFDWKNDKAAYEEWVKKKTGQPAKLFENQLEHLLQIQELRKRIMDAIKPAVTNKEAYQEFLNEWNTLGVGLAQFDELKDARKFYKRAKRDPEFWDKEKKERPDGFRDIRPVSLEFLIDMWRFPRSACYKMMKMKVGKIHPPAPIYKGYGVFKISSTRPAVKSQYKNRKESYYKQIEARKKRIGLSEWIEDLKRQANIEVYEDVLAKIKGTEPKAAEEAEEKDISEKGE